MLLSIDARTFSRAVDEDYIPLFSMNFKIHIRLYCAVTDLGLTTTTPFLTFTFHLKLDKKEQMIKGEYGDFDIVSV